MSRAAASLRADLFFFPASYSFYPILSRVPKLVCIHDTIPERFPDLIFPTKRNFRLWQIKTWLAKTQARRVLTVSETSATDIAAMICIPRGRIDVTTEGAEDLFRPKTDALTLAAARARHGLAEDDRVLTYIGGFNRHKNVATLIAAMPAILDVVPFWRPVAWAAAVVVVDALAWGGADPGLLERWAHLEAWPQALLHALLFRLAVHAQHPACTPASLQGLEHAARLVVATL